MSMMISSRELAVSVEACPTQPFDESPGDEPVGASAPDGAGIGVADGLDGGVTIERFQALAALALATAADPYVRLVQGRAPTAPSAAGKAVGSDATDDKEQVKSAFKQEFGTKAADKAGFHAFMREVYGSRYDQGLAEQYRQRALAGDYGWLPDVKFVDEQALGGANGAYNAEEGVVYISRELAASDPGKAAQTFVEEAGHHLDAKLNGADTRGDEGEMFRRVLSGEQLSAQQIAGIRGENDHGTIVVDGKQVAVEFWFGEDIGKAFGDAADAVGGAAEDVGEALGDAAEGVGDALGGAADDVGGALSDAGDKVRDAAYSFGDAIKHAGGGLIGAAETFMEGLGKDLFGGIFMNMIEGRPADALKALGNGLDKMVLGAPKKLFNGMLDGAGDLLKTPTFLLPDFGGGKIRDIVDRGVDSVRSLGNGVFDIGRTVFRLPFEIGGGFVHDAGEALKEWARGDLGGGFERLGMAFVNPFRRAGGAVVDIAMIGSQAVGNVAGNATGEHSPSRGLDNAERNYLKGVYGDSLKLDDIRVHRGNLSNQAGIAPHAIGNDIYLPEKYFNSDGTLNALGLQTLAHEAFHVYQSQHGGNDYISDSLQAQTGEILDGGSRNAAYDWVVPFREGKPFEEWNPEQQAKFIETIAKAKYGGYDDGDGQIELGEFELAWEDANGNGMRDVSISGLAPDPEADLTLSPEEFQRVMAIWSAVKDDRPDRTVV